MAPEQAAGDNRAVGPAADIYALGAILYELLTGRPPFRGATPLDTLEQTLSQEPVPPDQLQGKLPRDLSTICLKCLQKEPARRYASAGELAEDLGRFLADRPIRARPSSWRERAWRWCRRNQHVAMLLLVIGLLMVGGMVGATVAAIRFERLARSETMAHRTADRMAEAERIARERADRHASESRAVVDFLITEMLAAARPDSKLGRTMTVDEVLARTSRAIEGQFADQPLVEAAIRHQIASAYHTLSMGRRAAEHAERARDLRARNLGPEHPLTLESALLVVQGLHNISAFGTALGPAEAVYKARLRTLGSDHPDTAFALYWVASCINNDPARLEEARSMFSRAIDICRRKLLANDPRLTFAMAGLAFTLANQGRYAESLAVNDELLQIYRRLWGPEHVEVALTLSRKAEVLAWSGRYEEAVQNCEEAVRMLGRVQDPGYIEAYNVMGHLLDLHTNQVGWEYTLGDRAKAERLIVAKILPLCDQRVARAEAWLARDARDPDARVKLVMCLAERGTFRAGSGRPAEALEDTDRALALGEGALFPAETTGGHRAGAGLEPDNTDLGPASDHGSWDDGALPLYKIAQVYALLATSCRDDVPQTTRYADRAIRFLRQAIALGFRRKQLILGSPGFPALRSRADFRAILERLPPRVEGATEGEALGILKTSLTFAIAPQSLPEKRYVGRWSGDAILIGSPRQVGEWVNLALPVPADGTYRVVAYLVAAPGHGIVRISLDGEPQGSLFDGFRPGADPRSFAISEATPPASNHDLGKFHLRKGIATLRIEPVGKNEGSSGFSWGLDCVVLQRSSDPSTHDVDALHPDGSSSKDAKN